MKIKLISRICVLSIIIVSIFSLFALFVETKYTYADEIKQQDHYAFTGDSIIVEIDKSVIELKNLTIEEIFSDYDIKDINEIFDANNTYMIELKMNYNNTDFILSDINKLNHNLGFCATPNYVGEFGSVPNDSLYSLQWGLNGSNGIDIEPVWSYEKGSSTICVGVIDTGISQHEDLVGNLVQGYSFVGATNDTEDVHGHGTHVAGIIGAVGNNNIGISGVAPNIDIMPLKISNTSSWETSKVIAAINYAQSLWGGAKQVDIINFSGWNFSNDSALYSAIDNYSGLFVTIAGNDHSNIDINPNYPGSFNIDNMITVGSIDSDGDRSSFSNYGTTVDIYAPGGSIYSTLPNNRYGYMSGTSMAAPHVTGVAALMLSSCDYITPEQLKTQLLNNADNITINIPSSSGGTTTMGAKALNALAAVSTVNEYWTGAIYASVYCVEGEYSLGGGNNFLIATKGYNVIKGVPLTVTAPSISGYTFQRWDIFRCNEGADITTITCSTSQTITITYEYIRDMLENGRFNEIDFCAIYSSNCIAEGTLITLADGSQKAVEDLTGNENLLVWNLNTGTFDSAPILFIDREEKASYEVIQLSFSDGTIVDVISEHGFWDVDLNEYVYLDEYAAEYIGHCFLKQEEDGMTAVTLVDVEVSTKVTSAYSPVTYGHLCYYVNGMLSMPGGIDGLFNIFEVDKETMMYDAEAMAADIAQYGLYTYEEFNALYNVPEVMFDACGGQYLKVALGKGLITEEGLQNLIDRYSVFFAE